MSHTQLMTKHDDSSSSSLTIVLVFDNLLLIELKLVKNKFGLAKVQCSMGYGIRIDDDRKRDVCVQKMKNIIS